MRNYLSDRGRGRFGILHRDNQNCFRLVDDLKGELNLQCVPRDARDGAVPAYVWAIVSIGLLLFAAGVAIVIYLLKHTKTFKILASECLTHQRQTHFLFYLSERIALYTSRT